MSSYRKQISEAAKAALLGKTAAGDTVFASLDRQLDPRKDLPAVVIYTMGSRRGDRDMGQAVIHRIVTVAIEAAIIAAPTAAQGAADDMADAIEAAIEADSTLGGLVIEMSWQESVTAVTGASADTMGVCLVTFEAELFSERPNAYWRHDGPETAPTKVYSNPRQAPAFGAETLEGCLGGVCNAPAWAGEVDKPLPEPQP